MNDYLEKYKQAQEGSLFKVVRKGDYLYAIKDGSNYSKLNIKTGRYFGYGDGGLVRNGEKELRAAHDKYLETGNFEHLDKFKGSGIKKNEID